jgi:hypothetical protein
MNGKNAWKNEWKKCNKGNVDVDKEVLRAQ